jgi:hypothetical protein
MQLPVNVLRSVRTRIDYYCTGGSSRNYCEMTASQRHSAEESVLNTLKLSGNYMYHTI